MADDKPAFDPSQPFTTGADKPAFDPNQAFTTEQPKSSLMSDVTSAVNAAAPMLKVVPMAGPALSMAAEHFDPNYIAETAKNVPHSALEFGRNIIQPFVHPVDTAENLKNLGLGILEKTGMVSGSDHEKYADAVGRYFADRYGSIENAKNAFKQDPVGVAADASMLLTGGEAALGRVPGLVGQTARAAGEIGRTVDPLNAVTGAAKLTGESAAHVLGTTTGVGEQPLKIAAEAGYQGGPGAEAFRANMRGQEPITQVVDDARGAVSELRRQRGDAYRAQMGPIKADSTVLDFNKIDNAVANAQGIKTYSGRSGMGPTQNLHPKTEAIRQEMMDAIENWKNLDPAEFHTPEGIDALKQQLGDIRDATQHGTPDRVVANKIYQAVRQTIIDQVPEYAKVMKGYEEASDLIKEIETTLSLKPNANISTTLGKLQSTLRNNVNTNFGRRAELADYLVNANAPHLMQRLAGQALNQWAPRGLSRAVAASTVPAIGSLFGMGAHAAGAGLAGASGAGLGALATLPAFSPRLMGEVAHGVGRLTRRLEPFRPAIGISRQIGRLPFAMTGNPYAPQ